MAFSLSSSSFIHPQLRHIVYKMNLFDTLLFFVSIPLSVHHLHFLCLINHMPWLHVCSSHCWCVCLHVWIYQVIHFVDKLGLWHRLPVLLGLAYMAIRRHLHQRYNLLHVGGINGQKYETEEFSYRTADGKCNHPGDDIIGSQGTFFGRNMLPANSRYGVRVVIQLIIYLEFIVN